MITRYAGGKIPSAGAVGCAVDDESLRAAAQALPQTLEAAMERLSFSTALEAIMRVVSQANQYVERQAPWQLAKGAHQERLYAVLRLLTEVLRVVAIVLEPFMPSVSTSLWRQLGCGDRSRSLRDVAQWPGLVTGQAVGTPQVLFPKAEVSQRS